MRFFRQTLPSVCLIFFCAFAFAQPVAVNDDPPAELEDSNVVFNITANDTDGTFNIVPSTVDLDISTVGINDNTFVEPGKGTFTVDALGNLTFTPLPNYNGTTTLQYTVQNDDFPAQTSPPGTITIIIDPVNDAPVAVDDNTTTAEDTPVSIVVTSNDSDVDGSINAGTVDLNLSVGGIQATFSNASGGWTVDGIGNVTYTPTLNYNGPAVISYRVNDNNGLVSNTATLTVSVTAMNDAPTAVNDNAITAEDTPVGTNVTTNDTDVDSSIDAATVDLDPGTVGIQTTFSNASGNWSVVASGVVTYTPTLNYNGAAAVTYRVNDVGGATSNSATFSVSVSAVNDAPTAVNDNTTTPEDTPVSFNVTTNDTDVDGTVNVATVDLDPGTAGIQTTFSNASGSWGVVASGLVTYTPTLNYNGIASVSYRVSDDVGLPSNTATLSVSVSSVNNAPVAVNDNTTTPEDTPVGINVTTNDTDVDGTIDVATVDLDPGTAGIQTTLSNASGGWAVAPTGIVTYTPTLNYNGPASVTYRVNDNDGSVSNTATLAIAVSVVNDAPTAVNDNTSTPEDTPVGMNVTTNDTDIDGTINAATVDLNPGTAGIQTTFSNASGSWSVVASGVVTYTPTLNYNGIASVSYRVSDNLGLPSNTATLSVSVSSVNNAPVAVNDNTTTPEDTPIGINVTTNDTDVDGTIDVATVDLDPGTAGIQTTLSNASGGWAVAPTGIVTYTPTLNYNGPASVTYRVNDNDGLVSNTATLAIAVSVVNDAPTAVNDNTTTPEDTPVGINVTTNDTDIDGTINAATVDLDPGTAGIQTTFSNASGSWGVVASGVVTYTPTLNYNGAASVTYRVNDVGGATSNSATFSVSVSAVNDAPTAVNDNTTTPEDTPVSFNVTTNDTDVDGTINVGTVDLDPGTAGIQTTFSNASGSWGVVASGVVTYTPTLNYNGVASVSYRVSDNLGLPSNTATLSVSVSSVNSAPVAVNDNTTTPEDTPVGINVTTNDTDVDGTIDVATVDLDPGTAGIQTTLSNASGGWAVAPTGIVTYTPLLNYNGPASVTYRVNDNDGLVSNTATLAIGVSVVNDAPTAVNDNTTTPEDTPVAINVTTNDTDIDGTINAASVDLDPGTVGIQTTFSNASGNWGVVASGVVTYTPTLNYNGAASITYRVNDNNGLASNTATLSVTVTSVNNAPVAVNDNTTTPEDTPVSFNVTTNDTDVDGTVNVATVDLDPGTVGIQATFSNASGGWAAAATGNVTYTPTLNFNGPAAVTYTVNDNSGLASNAATLTVSVTVVNDAPVAVNDNTSTIEDTPVTLNVTTNDTDVDGTIDAASVDLDPATAGKQVTFTNASGVWDVVASGAVTYTPALNFNGPASVTYRVNDNNGLVSSIATLSITVTPGNDAPVAVNDNTTTPEDTPVTLNVTTNDTDIDGSINASSVDLDPATAGKQITFTNAAGTWDVIATGAVTYTPLLNFNGAATVTYEVNDNLGAASNTATLTVTVTGINDAPVAVGDNATTPEDTPVTVNVTTNDTDVDGTIDVASVDLDPITAGKQITITNASGVWDVVASGAVTYTPALNFNGAASVTYRVNDDSGLASGTATLAITVTAQNDPPAITTTIPPQTIAEDAAGTGALAFTITDADSPLASLTLTGVSDNTLLVPNGNITFGGSLGNRTVTVVPALNQNGVANIGITLSDGNGGSASTTFLLTVTAVNDAPVITGQNTVSTVEEQNLEILFSHLTVSDPDHLYPTGFTLSVLPNPTFYTFSATTITPNLNVTGNIIVKVQVNDGVVNSNIYDLQVTVNPINDPPVITAQSAVTINEDPAVPPTIVLSNLTIVDPDNTTGFVLSLGTGSNYSLSGNQVIPDLNFNGALNVPVTVSDGNSSSAPFNFLIQVNAVNDKPIITGQQAISIAEVQPVALSLSQLTVFDPDNSFPTGFSLFILGDPTYSITGNTVTPIPNFSGTLKVKIFINDGAINSDVYELQVLVNSTNDAPIITGHDPLSTNEGQPLTLDFDDLDVIDPDNPYPTGFSMTILPGANYTVSALTITPAANFEGALTVFVKVNDGDVDSAPFQITISVIGVNTPPSITGNVPLTVPEDNSLLLQIAFLQITDPDSPPSSLTMTVNQTPGPNYTVSDKTITPAANFSGTLSVPVTVSDGSLTSLPFNVQIVVSPVNDAPSIALKNTLTTLEDQPITLTLADFTITDVDNTTGFVLNLQQGPGPNYSVSGTTVTPNANFNGAFGIGVTISDGEATGNTVEPIITVNSINDAPTLNALSNVTISEDEYPQEPLVVLLSGIAPGVGEETQTLTVSASSDQPDWFDTFEVIYTVGSTASLRIKPKANVYGSVQITVRIEDNGAASPAPNVNFVTRTFTLIITPVNDLPVFTSTPNTVAEPGQPYEYLVIVTDIEGEVITLTGTTIPAWLTLTPTTNGNATLTGIPPANATGSIPIVLEANDPASTPATQLFTIVVNTRPTIESFNITLNEEGTYVFSAEFTNNFTDFDGNPLSEIQITQLPIKGTLKLNPNGTVVAVGDKIPVAAIPNLSYTGLPDSTGTDDMKWAGSDGTFYSLADATINITIEDVNDRPEIIALEPSTDTLQYEFGSEIPIKFTRLFDARDVDGDDIKEADIRFSSPEAYKPLQDQFLFTDTLGITGSFNDVLGILKLTGTTSVENYVAAVRSIKYNFVAAPDGVPIDPSDRLDDEIRAVSIKLNDGLADSETKERLVGLIYTFMDIDIASAFTPNNGDDKNQFWRIYSPNGLERYRDAQIKVYNKRGVLVHEATGFSVPWNGNGPEGALPADSYYYTIDLKYDRKKYKGVVTILR